MEDKNATKLKNFLLTEEKVYLNYQSITKILTWLRRTFAPYLKDYYRFNKLGRAQGGSLISIDESLFVKSNGVKFWIIGAKNNKTLNIRIDIFNTRSEEDCKTFIFNHIKENNTIITDGWSSYRFLDRKDSDYLHEVHIHGPQDNFGFGAHSTSIIEGTWGTLKSWIERIYRVIPEDNFVLYLREAELRYILSKLTIKEKEEKIIEIFNYLYNSSDFDLYDDKELIHYDNYDW